VERSIPETLENLRESIEMSRKSFAEYWEQGYCFSVRAPVLDTLVAACEAGMEFINTRIGKDCDQRGEDFWSRHWAPAQRALDKFARVLGQLPRGYFGDIYKTDVK
jgi:hypothetical protein